MKKSRISTEYRDGCRSFMDFAIRCKTPDGLIFCPCKTCRLNRQYPPRVVYDHLTGGKGMWLNTKTEFITARGQYELPLKALI
jgi:hypothetical protein